ncbi:MAG: ATP phosphoribosyltransferase regulatory subunit [Betaproteobacteria bacterium AqS2]|uniref:ATP phosphoribosyltransferase regulatory subunit n=1 Tax=Candidatus Amphirhobacter heronislandensis TaxID=1732024 RepID=A0A930UAT6_9GAMM|nr:ATP phosphoribosyltransferase regulatory subunit [Betaproteobacteria bacterium AqS2]
MDAEPKGPASLLFGEAETVERASRELVAQLLLHGYGLAQPPLAADDDGVRADLTPQVARLYDRLGHQRARRMCYCGPALAERVDAPWEEREILQVGAELFGHGELAAAIEVASLAARLLGKAGVKDPHLTLGHAGLLKHVARQTLPDDPERAYEALARKDVASVLEAARPNEKAAALLRHVTAMRGAPAKLDEWFELPHADASFPHEFRDQLKEVAGALAEQEISVSVDVTGAAGAFYHSCVSFALMSGATILGYGGNYATPAGHPACGFSLNARKLPGCCDAPAAEAFAAWDNYRDPAWRAAAARLIDAGRRMEVYGSEADVPADAPSVLAADGKGGWSLESR